MSSFSAVDDTRIHGFMASEWGLSGPAKAFQGCFRCFHLKMPRSGALQGCWLALRPGPSGLSGRAHTAPLVAANQAWAQARFFAGATRPCHLPFGFYHAQVWCLDVTLFSGKLELGTIKVDRFARSPHSPGIFGKPEISLASRTQHWGQFRLGQCLWICVTSQQSFRPSSSLD
jgi:hypothetical protein